MDPLRFHVLTSAIEVGILKVDIDLILRHLFVKGDRLSALTSALLLNEAVHQHVKGLVSYRRLMLG